MSVITSGDACPLLQSLFAKISARGAPWAVFYDTDRNRSVLHHFGEPGLDPEMHIRLASVSKLVVGWVFARLVQDGTVSYNDPVQHYLPDLSGYLEGISLQDLATHRTGFRDALHDRAFRATVNRDVTQPQPIDAVIGASLALPKAEHLPAYANINAILLGQACAHAAGRPFNALLPRVDGLFFPADGTLPTPHPRGMRYGRPGRIEYGKKLLDATHYNAAWAGISGTGVLRLDAIPAFCRTVLAPLANRSGDGFSDLMWFQDGWGSHAGDLPGFSTWAGHNATQDRSVFAAVGLCWDEVFGNPAEYLAKKADGL